VKPYNKKARCPKCGGEDIGSGYHRRGGIGHTCAYGCPAYWQSDIGEHIKRHCKNCHYEWLEAPLDAKAKKQAMSTKEFVKAMEARLP
jgi:predicted nucleic-acid-binding Zn-ribbon protein